MRQQQFGQFACQRGQPRGDGVPHVLGVRHRRRREVRGVEPVDRLGDARRVVDPLLGRGDALDVLHLVRLGGVLHQFRVTQQQDRARLADAPSALVQVRVNLPHLGVGRGRGRLEHHARHAAVEPPLGLSLERRGLHVGLGHDAEQPRHAARGVHGAAVLPQVHHVFGRDPHGVRPIPAVVVPGNEARVGQHRPGKLRGQDVRRHRHAVDLLAHVEVRAARHLLEPEQHVQPHRARVDRVRVLQQVEHRVVEHLLHLVAGTVGVRGRLADERLDPPAVGRVLGQPTIGHLAAGLGDARAGLAEQPQRLPGQHRGVDRRRPVGRARDAARDQFVVAPRVLVVVRGRRLARDERRRHPRAGNLALVGFDRLLGGSLCHGGHAQPRVSVASSSVPASDTRPTHAPIDALGPSKYMHAYRSASRPSSLALIGSSLAALPS